MKQLVTILALIALDSTRVLAFELQVDRKNPKANLKDVKTAELLVRSLADYFPHLLEGIKLNICGTGGPGCPPENSYPFDSNEINLELTAYGKGGEIKYKLGALQVLVHEYGHAVFIQRAVDRHRNYANLFAAVKYKIEQDQKLLLAKTKNLTQEIREIESELESQKETITIANNYFYVSFFYQEVYSDFLAAAHFENPDIMCLALDGTVRCKSPSSALRRFSVSTSIEVAKKMTVGNPQAQHSALAPTRKALWQKYQSLLKAGNSKEVALNFLLNLMVDEGEEIIFGKKTYGVEEMNMSLINSLRTYGK